MTIKKYIAATGRVTGFERRGAERIPGTDKVRTYCANTSQYSQESDLDNIIRRQRHSVGANKRK